MRQKPLFSTTLRRATLLCSFLFTLIARGELIVNSSNGYQVHIYIQLTQLIPSSMTCPWGYNYNVAMNYQIWFTGSNIPASLYTLQGTVGCGSEDLFFDLPNDGGDGTTTTTSNPYRSQSDCATATLGTLGCNSVRIQIEGPGIPSQFINYNPDVLPIELISFTATPERDHVRLDWATATETNNEHFTIERSRDGSDFHPVERIPGAGTSTQLITYSGFDRNALSGLSYYRLKQTDINGAFSYSHVLPVLGTAALDPIAVPNPCAASQFQLGGQVIGQQLDFHTLTGKLVRSTLLNSNTVDRSGLPAGVYELRLVDPTTTAVRGLKLLLH